MGMNWARAFAASGPPPVFAAIGAGGLQRAEELHGTLRLQRSPRQAAILLVLGEIAPDLLPFLQRLHDHLPHPRATIWHRATPPGDWTDPVQAKADGLERTLTDLWRSILSGDRASEPDFLPDKPPNEWRGVGPHGQGGKGMMGGTPYGRPMAMTNDDLRDGLSLDAYSAPFGPFLPMLPPGLILDLTLQGDVIQSATATRPPCPQPGSDDRPGDAIARLMRVMDMPALALRRTRDGLPPAMGIAMLRRAIPDGLGRARDGTDVRDRLDRWRDKDAPQADDGTRLSDLLPGLEWHEAMIVLNSFQPDRIRAICARSGPEGGDEDDKDGNRDAPAHAPPDHGGHQHHDMTGPAA